MRSCCASDRPARGTGCVAWRRARAGTNRTRSIRDLPIRIVPLDAAVAEDAAWIRGASGIGLEDAVQLASARFAGATAFVTNDRRLRSIPDLDVIYLDDLVA